jgi:hypothetical protein
VFAGHLAVALAGVKARPRVPLWLLLLASQAPDVLQLLLGALGHGDANEARSHSIPVVLVGAIILAGYQVLSARDARDWAGGALVMAVALSHPLLDLVTGVKALWPGAAPIGACLYDRPAVDLIIESAISIAGWLVYRTTLGARRTSNGVWLVLATLLASQLALDGAQEVRLLRTPDLRMRCFDARRN